MTDRDELYKFAKTLVPAPPYLEPEGDSFDAYYKLPVALAAVGELNRKLAWAEFRLRKIANLVLEASDDGRFADYATVSKIIDLIGQTEPTP